MLLLLSCSPDSLAVDPVLKDPVQTAESPASPAGEVAQTGLTPNRIVAIGDIHGDPSALLHVLSMAGLVDKTGRWTGGNTTVVQTGDTTDRGPDSKGVLSHIRRLQGEAHAAGGKFIALLGNHEVMNMQGDLRYVNPADTAGYGGEAARAAAYSPTGADGRWLRTLDAVVMVGDTVFCHGGVNANWAERGIAGMNREIHAALAAPGSGNGEKPRILGPDGPLWYRGYLLEDEAVICPELARALKAMGASRLVVGHTTQDSGIPAMRCGGQLWGIDTGISAHYGNHYAALEIAGELVTPLLPTSRVVPN